MKSTRILGNNSNINQLGFTIVELLVVIVIIGILAAITIVSYVGLSKKANEATLISDLSAAKKQLSLYNAEYNSYPTSMTGNCPTAPVNDTNYCIKTSGNSSLSYNVGVNGTTFSVRAIKDSMSYAISDATAPVSTVNTGTSTDWINIGSQTWAKNNLNVGTIITGLTNQTNNSVLEKYCFNDLESNCDAYGALYQWNEAMQYSNTEGTQGICPVGSHIPSDSDWKKLEMQIGLTQSEANIENDWRGTDQGAQLKSGGSSGLSLPFAGGRYTDGSFFIQTTGSFTWSSTELGSDAWHRYLHNNTDQVGRYTDNKGYGFSVRCLAN